MWSSTTVTRMFFVALPIVQTPLGGGPDPAERIFVTCGTRP